MRQHFANLLVLALLSAFSLVAQTSHRQLNPQPRTDPNDIFKQLEKQNSEPGKEGSRPAVARQQRSANLAELERDLPLLIDLAQSLQNRLRATNLETALPAGLEQQAKELEQAARRVHKRIRTL